MRKIGILHGNESALPISLIQKIDSMGLEGVCAESLKVGVVEAESFSGYRVIIDRISHQVPFYRSFLKNAALTGSRVVNNPFWWSADDRFFQFALAQRLGVAIPRTVLLPQKCHPQGVVPAALGNLVYPLDWDAAFRAVGFPAYLKSQDPRKPGATYRVCDPTEFFAAYDQTGDDGMILQAEVATTEFLRGYIIGPGRIHLMRYDPRRPPEHRYLQNAPPIDPAIYKRALVDCRLITGSLGYEINMIEFAVADGIPYAIDLLNPAPEADLDVVGTDNFVWIVDALTELATRKAAAPYMTTASRRSPLPSRYSLSLDLVGASHTNGQREPEFRP